MPPRRKPAPPKPPEYPRVIETYIDPKSTLSGLRSQPFAVNGHVYIRRYRVTVELVDEPVEVLRERLKKLWRESERNTHLWDPIRQVGYALGLAKDDFPFDEQGADYKGRW